VGESFGMECLPVACFEQYTLRRVSRLVIHCINVQLTIRRGAWRIYTARGGHCANLFFELALLGQGGVGN